MPSNESSDNGPPQRHDGSQEPERRIGELHRLLVESVHDYAIYALTSSGHVASWNPGAERLKGYSAQEIIGVHFSRFYPPDQRDSERPAQELEIATREGRFEEEAWRARKNGELFWANVIVSPIRDHSGELLGFAKITRDLSSRRIAELRQRELAIAHASAQAALAAETESRRIAEQLQVQSAELEARNEEAQALAEELEISNEELQNAATSAEEARDAAENARRRADELQQRYHRIFESSPLPIFTVQLDTLRLLDVNGTAITRYGYSREEFLELHLHQLRAGGTDDTAEAFLVDAAIGGVSQLTTRHRAKSGAVFDVEVRTREVTFEGRQAMVAVVTDITQRLRQQARQQFLMQATEALGSSLDYEATLRQVVTVAVPHMADWAAYQVLDGSRVRTVAIHHSDPEMESLAAVIDQRYPMQADAGGGSALALATGKPELIREVPDEVLRAVSHNEEHYGMLRSIGLRSMIHAPVLWRGEVIGVLGFATGESARLFDEDDLELAMELARRAAMALQNARLFDAEHRARDRAERNSARLSQLQRMAEQLSRTIDVTATTNAIVDEAVTTIGADAAYVAMCCPDPNELELVHGRGYPIPLEHARVRFSAHDNLPGANVVRSDEPQWLESHAERNVAYPALAASPISIAFGATATLPLSVSGKTVGALGLHFVEERAFDEDARAFLSAFAEQAALTLSRAKLFEEESRARDIAERLQAITAALSEAATPAQVTETVVSAGLRTLGAGAGFVALLREDRTALDIIRSVGFGTEGVARARSILVEESMPVTDAARNGEPVWIASVADAKSRYPSVQLAGADSRFHSWAALPLIVDGEVRGAMGLSFEHETAVAVEHRELMLSLARQCAQALERARLFEAEQRARREADAGQSRAEFLAEASRQLGSSLDYHITLESVARAAVPRLGDWCAIDMRVDTSAAGWPPVMKRLAVMHSDPAKIEWARELEKRQPPDWDAATGVPHVLREGVSEYVPVITDDLLVAAAKSEEHLALLREIGLSAYICVPLKVRGRTVGVITLVMAESKRPYTEADLALAEELATRASLAIENADLFRDAQQANAAKAQFMAVMSHELRTPLNAIGGYAELLELGVRGALNEEQAHDIQRIKRSQHHLLALINDVLNFARIEAGHVQYHFTLIPLSDALEEVVSLLVPQASARQLTIEISRCDDDTTAYADNEKTQQVLLNLLSNAVKFTLPGGSVRIECRVNSNTVDVEVSDTGIGIPEDRLAAIFDPFVQVHSGLTRSAEGTGLGLSISRDLARGMRGDLRVHSVLGEGSTFTLSLPRQAP